MTTWWRVHWSDCPPLSEEHAWSALWGATRSEDGSQTECRDCDGSGDLAGEPCTICGGEGWEDSVPGYSCAASPEALLAYFDRPGMEPWGETVIAFEGRQVDTGFDGEPTAVPTRVLQTWTWEEFVAAHRAGS
ncbi:hypothetical protein [Streptomyces carpaticus]|uniref:Uncharacterized protein n=1 Tax=Streptomyces carpaticus TaxID=285558 RepID=A0ABV4ZUE3_9ACTN